MRCVLLSDCDLRPENGRKNSFAMKKILSRALLCAAAGLLCVHIASAQHSLILSVDQPESPLTVDAGADFRFDGTAVRLGGEPAARGGYGDYTYRWEPAEYLDDPAAPNPTVTRLEGSVTFVLTVRDAQGLCEKRDEVHAEFSAGSAGLPAPEVTAFPNPFSDAVTFASNVQMQAVTVTDMTGKHIAQEGISQSENFRFNTGLMAPGLYLFSIRFTDGSTIVKKLCKIH